jgi:hypothetical protein
MYIWFAKNCHPQGDNQRVTLNVVIQLKSTYSWHAHRLDIENTALYIEIGG